MANTGGRTHLRIAAPPAPHGTILKRFELVPQSPMSNWCWAAVSVAVAEYFGRVSGKGSSIRMCDVVTSVLKKTSKPAHADDWPCPNNAGSACCKEKWGFETGDACAMPAAFDTASRAVCGLQRVGHCSNEGSEACAYKLDAVKQQIDAGQPLAVLVRWASSGGGNHYVTVAGYSEERELIHVADPLAHGNEKVGHWHTMPANSNRYVTSDGVGIWKETIQTRQAPGS